jgi:hypothetical protein
LRKVFVLVDGTGCTLLSKTNIGHLHGMVKDAGFEKHYVNGIGSFSRTKQFDRLLAPNLEPKALEIFQIIYDLELTNDDRLYIFGYSRGAVIARTLAMCIVSNRSRKAAARSSGAYGSIQAQIEFLCLFDPVLGRPRVHRSYVRSHEAVFEERIKHYVELNSCDEGRYSFPSDSYSASSSVKEKSKLATSAKNADTTGDRMAAMRNLYLRKTRRCVWFPGKHSDIGGGGESPSSGAQALATALEELLISAERAEIDLQFKKESICKLVLKNLEVDVLEENQKNGFFRKLGHKIASTFHGRTPDRQSSVIQHLAHQTCKHSVRATIATEGLPEYPDYKRLRLL